MRVEINMRPYPEQKPEHDGWYVCLILRKFIAGDQTSVCDGIRFVGGKFTVAYHETVLAWCVPEDITIIEDNTKKEGQQ